MTAQRFKNRLVQPCALRKASAVFCVAAVCMLAGEAIAEETRGYVVSWFHTATYNDKETCAHGLVPLAVEQDRRNLLELGYRKEEIEGWFAQGNTGPHHEILAMRGRVNGKAVDPYKYPTSVPDPHMKTAEGTFAYGFDLDGATTPEDFTDVDTKTPGVNNQLFRVVGCMPDFRINLPTRPINEQGLWQFMIDNMPAWVISITGDDLGKDGEVTVRLSKALYHQERDASGNPMPDVTYVLDQKARSANNILHGQIKNGVVTVEPRDIYLEGEAPTWTKMELHNMHLRLHMKPDGSLEGYMGGYLPWLDFYYVYAQMGRLLDSEGVDVPGLYYSLRRHADAGRDPKTGQNMLISSAFRIEAVPAFIATLDGKVVATAK